MNTLQIFENEQFGRIRTVMIDGEPWFVGKDVAEALGYANSKDAISTHVDGDDKRIVQRSEIATFGIPNRGMTIINESGLYSLAFSSKLETAKDFKRWVTHDVLPSIRKTGGYSVAENPRPAFSPSPSDNLKYGDAVKMGEFVWKLGKCSGCSQREINEGIQILWESRGVYFPPALLTHFPLEQTSLFDAKPKEAEVPVFNISINGSMAQ